MYSRSNPFVIALCTIISLSLINVAAHTQQRARPAAPSTQTGSLVSRLTPIESGPGILIVSPDGPDAASRDLGAGINLWLQYALCASTKFGKMPATAHIQAANYEAAHYALRMPLSDALALAKRLGVTHVATSDISVSGTKISLSYRIYSVADSRPIAPAFSVSLSSDSLEAGMQAAARRVAEQLGDAQFPAAEKPGLSAAQLASVGHIFSINPLDWSQGQIKTLAAAAELDPHVASLMLLHDNILSDGQSAACAASVQRRAAGNPVLLANAFVGDSMPAAAQKDAALALVQSYPNSSLAHLAAARVYRALADVENEKKYAEMAVRLDAQAPRPWLSLAQLYENRAESLRQGRVAGDLTEAEWSKLKADYGAWLSFANRAAKVDPNGAHAWAKVAIAATFADEKQIAFTAYDSALEADPSNFEAMQWGLQMFQPKWFDDEKRMVQLIERLLKTDFSDGYAAGWIAAFLSNNGVPSAPIAERFLGKQQPLVAAHPDAPGRLLSLAKFYELTERYEEAALAYEKLMEIGVTRNRDYALCISLWVRAGKTEHLQALRQKHAQLFNLSSPTNQQPSPVVVKPVPVAPSQPTTSPAQPTVSPAKPAVSPAQPAVSPAKPTTAPAKPAASPAKPAVSPAKPAASPAKPAASPAKPAVSPAKPAVSPAQPTASPAKPAVSAAKPAASPSTPVAHTPTAAPVASAPRKAASGSVPPTTNRFADRVKELLDAGDQAGCEKVYREWIAAQPGSAAPRIGLANLLESEDKIEPAIAAARGAAERDPSDEGTYLLYRLLRRQGSGDEAIKVGIQSAGRKAKKTLPFYLLLGNDLLAAGRASEAQTAALSAETVLKAAANAEELEPDVLLLQGDILMKLGKKTEAIAVWKRAGLNAHSSSPSVQTALERVAAAQRAAAVSTAAASPYDTTPESEIHSKRSSDALSQQKREIALLEIEEAVRLAPRNAQYRDSYANVLAQMGRPDDALKEMRTANRLDDTGRKCDMLYQMLRNMGKMDEAVQLLREEKREKIALWPYIDVMSRYQKEGKLKEVADLATRALALADSTPIGDPSYPGAYFMMGEVLADAGKTAEAKPYWQKAFDYPYKNSPWPEEARTRLGIAPGTEPDVPPIVAAQQQDPQAAEVHLKRRVELLQKKEWAAAEAELRLAVSLDFNNAYRQYELAQWYEQTGRKRAAEAPYRIAARVARDDIYCYYLCEFLKNAGRTDEAVEAAKAGVNKEVHQSVLLHVFLGNHYLSKGETAEARKVMDIALEIQKGAYRVDFYDPPVYLLLGDVLLKEGKKVDARAAWKKAADYGNQGVEGVKTAAERLSNNP